MLIVQWALAAHACAIQWASPARDAVKIEAVAPAGATLASLHDCHDVPSGTVPTDGWAACMKHCADERSASGGAHAVATAAMAPPAVIRMLDVEAPVRLHWEQAPAGADATAPPLSILYGVFLS